MPDRRLVARGLRRTGSSVAAGRGRGGGGPRRREATINLTSRGEGTGVAQIVLQYPDGQSKIVGNGVLEEGTSLGFSRQDYPPGDYRYTVYAVATATPPPDAAFPANAQSEDNVVASGGFTID